MGAGYIYERIFTDGRLTYYQVKIRRKGFPKHIASFDEVNAAKRFVRQVLGDQDRGHKIDRLIGHRTSVGEVIDEAIVALVSGSHLGLARSSCVVGWSSFARSAWEIPWSSTRATSFNSKICDRHRDMSVR